MSLRVIEAGLETRVVDGGRPHCRSLGVPVGGAADRTALALGNALVGNPPDAAALEFCLRGPTLRAEVSLACAFYGSPFVLSSNQQSLSVGKSFTFHEGEEIHVGGTPQGMRGYLCVGGGFQLSTILDSRSSLEPLRGGEILPCSTGRIHGRFFHASWVHPGQASLRELLVLPGLQEEWFQKEEFFNQEYQVTPASNRMGVRLLGRPLTMPQQELISEPVCPGAVQVTRDGQCIILGIDGQTIGGYPKIAQVISADLDQVGQLRPGDKVWFIQTTMEKALDLYHERRRELSKWVARLRVSIPHAAMPRFA